VLLGRRPVVTLLAVVVGALAFAGGAFACVCAALPIDERLDQADAAVIGRVNGYGAPDPERPGDPVRVMTFDVEQRVKGDVEGQVSGIDATRIVVRVPQGTDCDITIETGETTGLLLTRQDDGVWFASLCSVVTAGELVAAGGEPRGGVIKVVLGALILGLVLSWALRRRARGTRPSLPGAPEP
jgi:MYXO-CTERM domain-containing protein